MRLNQLSKFCLTTSNNNIHLFLTDKDHRIIEVNPQQMKMSALLCGINKMEDLRGLYLSDIYINQREVANELCRQNEDVMRHRQSYFFHSTFLIPHLKKIKLIVTKFPVYDHNNLIGVFGIAHYVSEISLAFANEYGLSKREIDCLDLLLSHKTANDIADCLGLSCRTVESYLDSIKNKMNCQTKKELVMKANQSGFKKIYI